MRGREAWLALAAGLGMVGAAAACSVGADPAARILIEGGGGNAEIAVEPDCGASPPSVARIIVDEGASVTFNTAPVKGTNCGSVDTNLKWEDLIKSSGTLKASEMFGDDPMELLTFIDNGEEHPAHKFEWTVSSNPGGVFPGLSGNKNDLTDLLAAVSGDVYDPADPNPNPPAANNYRIVPPTSGGASGRLVVALNSPMYPNTKVRTIWHINKVAGGLPPEISDYDEFLPDDEPVGYNSTWNQREILSSDGTETRGGSVTVTFDTPTFRDTEPSWGDIHYSAVGEVSLPWGFDNVSIPIGVCLFEDQPIPIDPVTNLPVDPPPVLPPVCNDPQDVTITFTGVIYHKGNVAKANEGHPAAAVIAVRDTSEPIAADSGTATGQAFAGRVPAIDPIEIEAWDNNPRAEAGDYTVQAWYLVERSVWGRDGTSGSEGQLGIAGDPGTYHAAFADDTFAASPGHAFRWVKAAESTANGVSVVDGPDGTPVGVHITFDPILPEEPTGVHFVDGVGGGGNYAPYVEDGLKLVYRVIDANSGKGHPADDPALDTIDPGLDVAQSWGGEIPEGYVTGGGAQTEAHNDGTADPSLLNECTACGGRAILAGLPTWSVDDDLPPSLVLIAHDKKYDKVYYFGHTMLGDANCGGGPDCNGDNLNQRYLDARQAGTISSPDIENMVIQPWNPSNTVFDDEGAFDYAAQRGEYLASFFPAALNYYGETYPGLWIDEDTRVEFFVTAWDNAEGWQVYGPNGGKFGGGVDTFNIQFELFDEPTAGGQVMSAPGTYLFRNPNRPDDLGRAYAKVSATDISGNNTEFEVDIFIADNSLKIYSLEESRSRLSND